MVGDFSVEAKERRGESLGLMMSTVTSRQTLGELPNILQLAADLGFRRLTWMKPCPVDDVAASLCPSETELSTIPHEELFDMAAAMGVAAEGLARHSSPLRWSGSAGG